MIRARHGRLGRALLPLALFAAVLSARTTAQDLRRDRVALIATDRDRGVEITPDLLSDLDRRIEDALAGGARSIVFEITSPGGFLSTAYDIVDRIETLRNGGTLTVAFVPRYALSAGALWAFACDAVILSADARIGNIKPLEFKGTAAFGEVPQKLVSDVESRVRRLAERNGWSGNLTRVLQKMVNDRRELVRIRRAGSTEPVFLFGDEYANLSAEERSRIESYRVPSPAGEVLTLTAREAREEFGFPFPVILDASELRPLTVADGGELRTYRIRSRSALSAAIPFEVRWILVLVGLIALIIELKQPGIGIFGLVSVLCFLGFFLLNADVGASPLLAFSVFLAGAFLLFVEILFVPGTFVAGILGTLLVVGSTYIATTEHEGGLLPDFEIRSDREGFERWIRWFTGCFVLGFVLAVAFGGAIARIPFLNRLTLRPQSRPGGAAPPGSGGDATGAITAPVAAGARGVAASDLRPSGTAVFDGRPCSVVTRGDFIDRGTAISVIEVEGSRIVVRRT